MGQRTVTSGNAALTWTQAAHLPSTRIAGGIQAARITIPLARFDAARCARGIDCLKSYQAEWDEPADVQANTAARLGIARSRCVPLSRDVLARASRE